MAATRPIRRKVRIPSPWANERPKREALRAEKREAILRAAAACFNERGMEATTMDDVASVLGVTKPTLYRLFRDKTALIEACQERTAELYIQLAEETLALKGSAIDKLKHFYYRDLHLMHDDEFGRMVVPPRASDMFGHTSRAILKMRERIGQALREIVKQGIASGEIDRSVDPKLAEMFLFAAFSLVGRWYDPKGPYTLDEIADRYFEMFLSGVRARR